MIKEFCDHGLKMGQKISICGIHGTAGHWVHNKGTTRVHCQRLEFWREEYLRGPRKLSSLVQLSVLL